ncbi:MAG: ABC transporter ATP-binding protein [Deferribacteres bacterium]|nr:ABC transporter ATP-binding protein [candidate division KSB1 bacterium]MCB9502899.1 ABC transporter ATP-binding protein [Deferribacteres bacterium]
MLIEIVNLNKSYRGGIQALQDVNLKIDSGMFGLLGPNGAGKSTLMKILATLEIPSSGNIKIDQLDLTLQRKQVRASLGYLPQFFGVYPQMSGYEFLYFIAQLNGVPRKKIHSRVMETLEDVALANARDRKVKTYSGGMVRRLGIAQALIHDPKLLIVDEPTVGLDPEERIRFRNLLSTIGKNKVIILSTHIVGDISSTCDDLAILSQGKIVYWGSPATLIQKAKSKSWVVECPEEAYSEIAAHMQIISTIPSSGMLQMRVVGEPVRGFHFAPVKANLEDAYMNFMEEQTGERVDEDMLQEAK